MGHMHRISNAAKHTLDRLTDTLWPGRSLISGLPARGALSTEDFSALNFITGAICNRCGRPQALDLGLDSECGACLAHPPKWTRARAALVYDDISRIPILAMKRAGRRDGLKVMANWMATAGKPLLEETDVIVPVPLNYRRLVLRGYNQAGWLSDALGRQARIPVRHAALKRIRPTPSQAGLSARERYRNVAGAFKVTSSKIQQISDQRVLLVDDVLTTGATLNACTKALLSAGAAQINVIVLARVVRDTDISI